MNVWLVTPGEPLPGDSEHQHLHKTGSTAKELRRIGHRVIWWTNRFDHFRRKYRKSDFTVPFIRLIGDVPYGMGLSIRRLLGQFIFALRFFFQAFGEKRPDVIVCSFPTPEAAVAAVLYGKLTNVPVVLDVRDLWPDSFARKTDIRVRLLTFYYRFLSRLAFSNCTAISGNTLEFAQWGAMVGKVKVPLFAFPIHSKVEESEVSQANGPLTICFMGSETSFDFSGIIEAARIFERENHDIQFVLCGLSTGLENLPSNITVHRWVSGKDRLDLLLSSDIGLAPYVDNINFHDNITNKMVEYLALGLPALTTVKGVFGQLIEREQCGFIVDGKNGSSYFEIIKGLHQNRELLGQMSKNARDLHSRLFTTERVVGDLVENLSRLVEVHRRPHQHSIPSNNG